ncbi:MAG: MoxR family ATPase [Pedosphaera sp.]|nr:MoxR family ATPase [Pedosphaera sp.]
MESMTLNSSKKVLASEAYRPRATSDFVGRLHESKMITAAWIGSSAQPPLCPLLVGEPGVGKNRLVYELSRRPGLDLYIFQGHEDVTAEDMACAVRFSDEPGRTMDYVVSPLVTAMHRGGICFIDEIGKIRPRTLALLASVLDDRRYIDSTLLGERVHAHARFRFTAATNTGETHALPEFIRSRLLPVIEVGHPPKEEVNQIISRQTANQPELEKFLGAVSAGPPMANRWHAAFMPLQLSDLVNLEIPSRALSMSNAQRTCSDGNPCKRQTPRVEGSKRQMPGINHV